MLCAYVNNNMRCYNESTEFADIMEDSLDPSYKVYIPPSLLLKSTLLHTFVFVGLMESAVDHCLGTPTHIVRDTREIELIPDSVFRICLVL